MNYKINMRSLIFVISFLYGLDFNCQVQSHENGTGNFQVPRFNKTHLFTDPFKTNVFIENLGQFNNQFKHGKRINFCFDNGTKIFLMPDGLVYSMEKREEENERENEKRHQGLSSHSEEREEEERENRAQRKPEVIMVYMHWKGCNPDVVVETSNPQEGYYTYSGKPGIEAKAYKKITYKNIYPNIDVEYLIPKDKSGIKYNLILRPGADISKIKMLYSGDIKKLKTDKEGNMLIETDAGEITDHAPDSYYSNKHSSLKSCFILKDKTVSFQLSSNDTVLNQLTETIVIDPWTTSPQLIPNSNVFNVDYDFSGNVYVAGVGALSKYSPTGAFLWTFTLQSSWSPYYSQFEVIPKSGSVFIGEGSDNASGTRMKKISTAGIEIVTSPYLAGNREIWSTKYNPCTGKLIGFGGNVFSSQNMQSFSDTNLVSSVSTNFNTNTWTYNDIGSVAMDENGDFYAILSSFQGAYDGQLFKSLASNNYSPPVGWNVHSGFPKLGEVVFIANAMTVRMNCLEVNNNYLYGFDGQTLKAWDKATGTLLGSIIVDPSYVGGRYKLNEGIAVNECDEIYVGGQSKVHTFTFNGNTFLPGPEIPTLSDVYDIRLNPVTFDLIIGGKGFVTVMPGKTCNNNPLNLTLSSSFPCSSTTMAMVSVSGGTPTYTYSWTDINHTLVSNNDTLMNVPQGTYYISVIDNSCIPKIQRDTVTIYGGIQKSISIAQPLNCYGDSNGVAAVQLNGLPSTASLSYLWSNNQHAAINSSLSAGWAHVTITINNPDCIIHDSIYINQPPDLILSTTHTNKKCYGDTLAQITAVASGGKPGYSFILRNVITSAVLQQNNTGIFNNLPGGNFEVVLTDSNNCKRTASLHILEPPKLIVDSLLKKNSICSGSLGEIKVYVSGGTGPYTYNWSNGNTNDHIDHLASGAYSVIITDSNFCSIDSVINIIGTPQLIAAVTADSVRCFGNSDGSLTVNVSGGSPPYLYSVNGAGFQAAQVFNGLQSGAYTVIVKDNNACLDTASSIVLSPTQLTLSIVTTADTCNKSNGSTAVTANGGTAGYTYDWLHNHATTNSLTNLTSGTYTMVVSDANSCVDTITGSVGNIKGPQINLNGPFVICEGDTAILTCSFLTAGTLPYSYHWSPGNSNTTSLTVVPAAGYNNYMLTLTDKNGCSSVDSTSVTVNSLPVVTAASTAFCSGDSGNLFGSGALTYVWNPAMGLSNPSIANPTVMLNSSITYTLTGINANGCIDTAIVTATVYALPLVTVNSDTICAGSQTVVLTAHGASTYSWNNSSSLSNNTGASVIASPSVSTTYSVTGTDTNGCSRTAVSIVKINPLPDVQANAVALCKGSSDTLHVSGASTYTWVPATGLSNPNSANPVMINLNATFTYTVTGTDSNGCKDTAIVQVTVNPLPAISITPSAASGCAPLCVNFSNTSNAQASCFWQFGDGTSSSSCAPQNCYQTQGTYHPSLTLTDMNGCVSTASIPVNVYPLPHANFNAIPLVTTILDPHIEFTNTSSGAVSWNWLFGDPKNSHSVIQHPGFTYLDTGSYQVSLSVVSSYGCVDTIVQTIRIEDDFVLYVPNAFTPNDDNNNELFFAKGTGIKQFTMDIFDRWGNLIFTSNNINQGWNGTMYGKGKEICQEDVYVWMIEAKGSTGSVKKLTGRLSLIK